MENSKTTNVGAENFEFHFMASVLDENRKLIIKKERAGEIKSNSVRDYLEKNGEVNVKAGVIGPKEMTARAKKKAKEAAEKAKNQDMIH